MRSPPPEEEGAAETTCDELTQTPIPRPPAPLGGEEVEKIRSKVKPGKKGGVGGRWFYFCFISHYPTLLQLIDNKLN